MSGKALALIVAYYATAIIAGLTALIYLFVWNWRVALAIHVLFWVNNIGNTKEGKR